VLLWLVVISYSQSQGDNQPKNLNPKLERLLKKLETSTEGPARIPILKDLVKEFRIIGDAQELVYATLGVELCQKLHDKINLSLFLHYVGLYYVNHSDYPKALEYYSKSMAVRNEAGDKLGLSDSLNNIGVVYRDLGELDKALVYYFKSKTLKEELGDKKNVASVYNNIGGVYYSQGHYQQALDYYFKSLKLKEELGDKMGMPRVYTNIGFMYEALGETGLAMAYHQKSLQISLELGIKGGIADSYTSMGRLYGKKGEFQQALDLLLKSLDLRIQIGDKFNISSVYLELGNLYLDQKMVDQALSFLFKSLEISKEIHLKEHLSAAYLMIGKCYGQKSANKQAIIYLNQAFSYALELNNTVIIRDTAEMLSQLYAQQNQFKEALQYHKVFKEKNDSLKIEENFKKITRLQMQYDFDKQQKQQELEQQKKDVQKAAELKQQRFQKIAFSGFAIFIALVFFILFRIKAKDNRRLQQEIQQREKAERELLKSMKLETVGILSAGIAHDFNNLLTIILGNLSMAQDELEETTSNVAPYVEHAQKASDQAADLIKNFLTLSEGGWAQKKKVFLADIVRDTQATSELKDIPFTISLPADILPLYADERQLRQVLIKLLVNAHEAYTGINREKNISLSAENIHLPVDNSFSLKEGDYIRVAIEDNGKGIPPELLEKVFDPYFSTKQRGNQKGMGLSLAVCYAIIQRHNGHIFLTSELEVGTTVHLLLPAVKTLLLENTQ